MSLPLFPVYPDKPVILILEAQPVHSVAQAVPVQVESFRHPRLLRPVIPFHDPALDRRINQVPAAAIPALGLIPRIPEMLLRLLHDVRRQVLILAVLIQELAVRAAVRPLAGRQLRPGTVRQIIQKITVEDADTIRIQFRDSNVVLEQGLQ